MDVKRTIDAQVPDLPTRLRKSGWGDIYGDLSGEAVDEIERLREQNDGLYLAIQMAQKEQERLRACLERIADWPDDNMATARTLHYDWRGEARKVLGRE